MEEAKFFTIGQKKFEFKDKDPIFRAEKAAQKVNIEDGYDSCICCDSKFKNIKSVLNW